MSKKPLELEKIAPGLFMQRKNIREVTHEADEEAGIKAYTEYVCDARKITESEYQMLKSIEDIKTQDAIDSYTEQLIEEGVIS